MADIKEIISGAKVTSSKDGFSATRVFSVTNLPTNIDAAVMFSILNLPNAPKYGDLHPFIPGLTVQSVDVSATGSNSNHAQITANYLKPSAKNQPPQLGEPARYSQSSYLVAKQTNYAAGGSTAQGRPLLIVRRSSEDRNGQIATAEVLAPVGVIRFTRRETNDGSRAQQTYLGKVNRNNFRRYPQKTLLCTSITADTDDGGQTYVITYEFQYNPETWIFTAVYTIDGQPIPDPIEGTSIKDYDLYEQADFTQIGI